MMIMMMTAGAKGIVWHVAKDMLQYMLKLVHVTPSCCLCVVSPVQDMPGTRVMVFVSLLPSE